VDVIAPEFALGILWTTWVASWMAAALWTARTIARQSGLARLGHGALVWLGGMLLFARPARLGALARPLLPDSPWMAWTGVILCAAGLGFTWWARVHLGRLWSGAVTLKADHAIVRDGPYAPTRHPIYTGLVLAVIGTALTRDCAGGLLGLVLIVAGLVVKSRQEERLLLDHFGPAYEAYRAEVPALVPRIR
jgi:protein-S-isoprenylcysteine O-methyltransferase Ste14